MASFVKASVITPRKPGLTAAGQRRAVRDALDDTAKECRRQLQGAVQAWDTPVGFSIDEPSDTTRTIWTDNEIFFYNDKGTDEHVIKPRVGKRLRFMGRNGAYVYPRIVHHPGTRAKNITKNAAARMRRRLKKAMDLNIKKAV